MKKLKSTPATLKVLIRDMKSLYAGTPWYGDSMRKILLDVHPAQVFHRPIPEAHCIAELTAHILAWRELLNRRLHGDEDFVVKQKESFDWTRIDPDPSTAWTSLLNALEANQQQIISALEIADDSLLHTKVKGRNYTFLHLIKGVMQHDTYHIGQIALLKKSLPNLSAHKSS
ncbi:MAG: DinB family protein [Thermoflavifilum sp.]|nr:DinB family protein [Thermoflavifilum sp.]